MPTTGFTFPKHYFRRPPRYNTPDPPSRDHIEHLDLPPPFTEPQSYPRNNNGAFNSSYTYSPQGLGVIFSEQDSRPQMWDNGNNYIFAAPTSPYGPTRHGIINGTSSGEYGQGSRGHTRSGSNIEILANVALSPDTYESPQLKFEWPGRQTLVHSEPIAAERPAKRARSEKLQSPIVGRTESRPATSYVSDPHTSVEEAELLLNLKYPTKFSTTHATPPTNTNASNSTNVTPPTASPTQSRTRFIDETAPIPESSNAPPLIDRVSPGPLPPPEHVEPTTQTDGERSPSPEAAKEDARDEAPVSPAPDVENKQIDEADNEQFTVAEEPTIISSESKEPLTEVATATESDSEKSVSKAPKRKVPAQVSQALCEGCKQAQITVAGEDQDFNSWIGCDACKKWYHYACAGFKTQQEVRAVDKFFCKDCEVMHGPTTHVRKSSRARTAIDYAGLNQGMVQSSADTPDHSYIAPIKEGKITFSPDNFPRMSPENVTAEYFEKSPYGMPRPIVIPAEWNPRPGSTAQGVIDEEDELVDFMADEHDEVDEDAELTLISDEGQDALDMVMPKELTVRKVSELYGPEEKLDVIDVKSQQADKRWTLSKWADYYESTGEKPVRNVISLEISKSRLGRLVRRPKIVRDLDLQDAVWPADLQAIGDYPKVQFYCLMSVADCYTDFHIDFGGSSVYYHILKGKKTFFFIPPKDAYLKKYAEWCNSPTQSTTFLGDETGECMRVDLSEGDTMLIPAGWIHAVWTPEDSLVIGGNFLTRMNYEMQIKVNQIEKDTKIALKFRYPFFQKINWYSAIQYLQKDPIPEDLVDRFFEDEKYEFPRERNIYEEVDDCEDATPDTHLYNARYYSQKEVEGWPTLRDFLYRTARIAAGLLTDGLTADTKRSVARSVPKTFGDPMHLIKRFAMWCAWKKGNVKPPEWVREDAKPVIKDKPRKAEPARVPGERQSTRVQSLQQEAKLKASTSDADEDDDSKAKTNTPRPSGLGPRRIACDACRKRRIRCRHKDEEAAPSTSPEYPRVEIPKLEVADTSIHVARPTIMLGGYDGPGSPQSKEPSIPAKDSAYPPLAGQDPITIAPATPSGQYAPVSGTMVSSSTGKKGRPKACEDCRKSKRRCVHDENGQLDPVKAAEPAKPRGSATNKRPARTSGDMSPPAKKVKRSSDTARRSSGHEINLIESARSALAETPLATHFTSAQDEEFEALLDPALRDFEVTPQDTPIATSNILELPGYTLAATSPTYGPSSTYPALDYKITHPSPPENASSQDASPKMSAQPESSFQVASTSQDLDLQPSSDMAIDPMLEDFSSTNNDPVIVAPAASDTKSVPIVDTARQAPSHQPAPNLTLHTEMSSNSMVSPPISHVNDDSPDPETITAPDDSTEITKSIEIAPDTNSEQAHTLHTPNSTSRHSSRQPKTTAVGPNTTAQDLHASGPLSVPGSKRTPASHSQSPPSIVDGGKPATTTTDNNNKRPGSRGSAKGPGAGSSSSPGIGSGRGASRSSFGEVDGIDPENLRLIKELQEQDFGLRRRGRS